MYTDARSNLWPFPWRSAQRFPAATLSYATSFDAQRFPFRSTSPKGPAELPRRNRARHFTIARGSAMECAAVLDVVRALGALQDEQYRRAVELLARVVAMLTKLCR